MQDVHSSVVVNSHNEWSQLKEVIIGAGFPETLPAADFSFKLFFHDNLYGTNFYRDEAFYITKKHIEEHNIDLENYSNLLTSLGVKVIRPKIPNKIIKTKTLTFESTNFPALNPRDLTMVVGNEIIESSPICRFRYFENDYLKHIFHNYFLNGSKWTVAPKPLLLDSSFDIDYVSAKYEKNCDNYFKEEQQKDNNYLKIGHEIMFDAACCMRLGKHIIFNVSNKNAELGYMWLQRHLPDYIIHSVNITDWHIDSSFVPLRPGLAIVASDKIPDKLPSMMKNWDFVIAPDFITEREQKTAMLASPLIDINVLSINENTIIANSANGTSKHLRDALKKYKVEVLDCPIRHSELFAGAHHCLTLDTVRESVLEDYFN
jgi:glycine amidinotransferase